MCLKRNNESSPLFKSLQNSLLWIDVYTGHILWPSFTVCYFNWLVVVVIIIIFSWKICDYESNSTKYTMLKRFNKWWDNWKESNNIIHEVVTCTVTMPCALVSLKWNALTVNDSIQHSNQSHHDKWYIIYFIYIQVKWKENVDLTTCSYPW